MKTNELIKKILKLNKKEEIKICYDGEPRMLLSDAYISKKNEILLIGENEKVYDDKDKEKKTIDRSKDNLLFHLENLIYCHLEDNDILGLSARKLYEFFELEDILINKKLMNQINCIEKKDPNFKPYRYFIDKNYNIIGEGSYIFVNVKNKNIDENNFFGIIKKDNEDELLINDIYLEGLPYKWITLIT